MKRFFIAVLAFVLAPALALAADPSGLWSRTNDAGETHIRIAPSGSVFTGTIEWMENPRNDTENPDPALQDRPLVGVQIFNDMAQVSDVKWEGSLYNPEDGNTYEGSLTVIDANTLELEGCVRIIIFPICDSDTWTMVPMNVSN